MKRITIAITVLTVIGISLIWKPKWNKENVNATISFDVSGYYIYLPAVFIYHDLSKVEFKQDIHEKYNNSSHPYQTFTHTNGNEIAKYSSGWAIQMTPFFLMGHGVALITNYPADGYSEPYQAAIHWGSLIIGLLGFLLAWKNLRYWFSERISSIVLLLLLFGTNYLNYITMDAAMPHNLIFFHYSLLIYLSRKFYENPRFKWAILIGVSVGLCALTRPTEIIAGLIPVFFGIGFIGFKAWKNILRENGLKVLSAIIVCILIGAIQFLYWKSIGGEWFIYSYEADQGFDWGNAQIWRGLFSYKKGWLVYTPLMILSILGIPFLWIKNRSVSIFIFLFLLLTIYIAFSWKCWWYGGSLGQRVMVPSYALLIFSIAALLDFIRSKNWFFKIPFIAITGFFVYHNLWVHLSMQHTGILFSDEVTPAYFKSIYLKNTVPDDLVKLLDTDEYCNTKRKDIEVHLKEDFENFPKEECLGGTLGENNSYCITAFEMIKPVISIKADNINDKQWLRAGATFGSTNAVWNIWRGASMDVGFYCQGKEIKRRSLRMVRYIKHWEEKELYLDVGIPKEDFDNIRIYFYTKSPESPVRVDDFYIESFNEKK